MRIIEDIKAQVNKANAINDTDALLLLMEELGKFEGLDAKALVQKIQGHIAFKQSAYREALVFFEHSLKMYEELGDRIGVASCVGNMGIVFEVTGSHKKAMEYYRRALVLNEELEDHSNAAVITGNLGNVFCLIGSFADALEHYERALQMHRGLGNRTGEADATFNISNVYLSTGSYPEALEHNDNALKIYEEIGDRSGVAQATGSKGSVFGKTDSYTESMENYKRALQIHKELGERSAEANVTCNIGSIYGSTGSYTEAREHFERALKIHEELGERTGVARASGLLAEVLLDMELIEEAVSVLTRMENSPISAPGVRSEHIGHWALVKERSGDLEAAQAKLIEALAVVSDSGLRLEQAGFHLRLRDMAQKRNDFEGYVEHNNEYTRITEEVNGKDTITKMAVRAKQHEIEAERKETEKQLAVLHSTLPKHIADRVAMGERVNDHHENAAVIFLDIVGFTSLASGLDPSEIVTLLEDIFDVCDTVINKHSLTKIKTIGDSYMCVALADDELPIEDIQIRTAMAALELVSAIDQVQVRLGIDCGPVVAGVIGTQRMQYDVWGDTVNVASRLESTGEAGRIQVSETFATHLGTRHRMSCTLKERGTMEVKGKGAMKTFWLEERV